METPYALLDSAVGKGAATDPAPQPLHSHGAKLASRPGCAMEASLPDVTPQQPAQLSPLVAPLDAHPQSVAGLDICRELERMLSPPVKFAPTTLDSVMRSIGRDDGGGMFSTPAGDGDCGGAAPAAAAGLAATAADSGHADGCRLVPAFEARLIEQQADGDAFCSPMELPPHAASHGCAPHMPRERSA